MVALLVFTLLVAMAAAVSQPAPASAGDPGPVRLGPSTGSYYNPVAPRLQAGDQQEKLGKLAGGAGAAKLAPSAKVLAQADAFDRKQARPATRRRPRSSAGSRRRPPRPARARGPSRTPPAPRPPSC